MLYKINFRTDLSMDIICALLYGKEVEYSRTGKRQIEARLNERNLTTLSEMGLDIQKV